MVDRMVQQAISNDRQRKQGYICLSDAYREWNPKYEPPYEEQHVRWCERSVNVKVGGKHL